VLTARRGVRAAILGLLGLLGWPRAAASAPPQGLTKLPELTHYVEAPYPPAAATAHREGTVVLAIDVDERGAVQRVAVVESAGPDFDHAAVEAAAQFEFHPAEAGPLGPVPVRITYRYAFVLRAPPELAVRTASTTHGARTASTASTAPSLAMRGASGPLTFLGTAKEAGTRVPVAFATITVSRYGTASASVAAARTSTDSDMKGRFGFRGLPPGEYSVRIRAPFFEPFEGREKIGAGEALEVIYYLTRSEKDPYEVVVRAPAPRREVARRTLTMEEITRIPGSHGDAIAAIMNLPGIARTPFGIGLLIVRGAPPTDTGIFLDGQRMLDLFHFGGIAGYTSVINTRTLEEVNFEPGGFGPEFGRVSAGIVDLKTREAATDRVHGEAQLDLLAGLVPYQASVFLEGPLTGDPDDGAFVLSLRRGTIDGVAALITSLANSSVAIAPRYFDYQLRWDKPLGDKRRMLTLWANGSDDELLITGADSVAQNAGGTSRTTSRTYFHRINPRFTYKPDADATLVISPIIEYDSTDTGSQGGASNSSGTSVGLRLKSLTAGGRIDGTLRLDSWVKLRAGIDFDYLHFETESTLPFFAPVKHFPSPESGSAPTRTDIATVGAYQTAIYTELELVFGALTLFPGLRLDAYSAFADPQPGLDLRLVQGRTLLGLDPRLTGRFAITSEFNLKAQAGVYQQPPLPNEFYLNADLPLQLVDQYSGGFDWMLVEKLSLDIQGFYRFGQNVPRLTGSSQVVNGQVQPVGYSPNGETRAYGMELLLKLDHRWDFFGFIAYTLMKSEQRLVGYDWTPNLLFDQTHNLNLVASYDLGLDWNLGLRFRYVTGGALPLTAARWYDADANSYSRTTSGLQRAPAFQQLDLYLEKKWVFDEWYFVATLDIENVLNHVNTEFYVPTFDFKNQIAFPGLPFFPTVIVKGVF
jgi:TonB family protein